MDGTDKAYTIMAALFALFFIASLLLYITHLRELHVQNIKKIESIYAKQIKEEEGRSRYWRGKYNKLQEKFIRGVS